MSRPNLSKKARMLRVKSGDPFLEVSPYADDEGQLIGRHTDEITPREWRDVPRLTAMQAVREKCLDCACGSHGEVRKCVATSCPLWPLRFGK
mgnify:CR=1 FL=1